jgi:hypothetical protein
MQIEHGGIFALLGLEDEPFEVAVRRARINFAITSFAPRQAKEATEASAKGGKHDE